MFRGQSVNLTKVVISFTEAFKILKTINKTRMYYIPRILCYSSVLPLVSPVVLNKADQRQCRKQECSSEEDDQVLGFTGESVVLEHLEEYAFRNISLRFTCFTKSNFSLSM